MTALLTRYELEQLDENQLLSLHSNLLDLLMRTDSDSSERCNILASLENIERLLGSFDDDEPVPRCDGNYLCPR